jgi:hypothetical protein
MVKAHEAAFKRNGITQSAVSLIQEADLSEKAKRVTASGFLIALIAAVAYKSRILSDIGIYQFHSLCGRADGAKLALSRCLGGSNSRA